MAKRRKFPLYSLLALVSAAVIALAAASAGASSHGEAPLIKYDPAADITDFFMFRSFEPGREDKVVFAMNVVPLQEPAGGPNFYSFDDSVVYRINIDNNADGTADDVVYELRFTTELVRPFDDVPLSFASTGFQNVSGIGAGGGGSADGITALSGAGSEGLGLRQRYTVTRLARDGGTTTRTTVSAGDLFVVPSNVGPRTMPDYESLAQLGIYNLSGGGRVFAGQRDDSFYADLGAIFDTFNFRGSPILSASDDADDSSNPSGVDTLSGFNVNTIAIEVPESEVTRGDNNVIGAFASTLRRGTGGNLRQVSRMGNPLVNELIIGTGSKDSWNAANPRNEGQFIDFYTDPRLARVLNAQFGLTAPVSDRTDLVSVFLKYPGQDPGACGQNNRCSELLRLDLAMPATAADSQRRLGSLNLTGGGTGSPDAAGWPNGRRPNDDVVDIFLRLLAGNRVSPAPNLGDGVNFNIGAPGTDVTANGIYTRFPFLPTPHDGRNRRHIDPGEPVSTNGL